MGLTYDGFDLMRYALVRLERPVGPEMRLTTETVPGRMGDVLVDSTIGTYEIVAHCTLRPRYRNDWQRVRRELAAAFIKSGEHILTLPDEPGLYRMASASLTRNVETPLPTPTTFDIEFTCHDPRAFGETREIIVPSGGSIEFAIDGMLPTCLQVSAPQARRSPSSQLWGMRFDEQDFMQVKLATSTAHAVAIDGERRLCTVDGATAMITLDSHWPELSPGVHVARMDQGTGAAILTWTEVYL